MPSLKIHQTEYEIKAFGERALILTPKEKPLLRVPRIGQKIQSLAIKGIREVIATDHDLTIFCSPNKRPQILVRLEQLGWEDDEATKIWKLPVYFEELEDWKRVEEYTGFGRETYIQSLADQVIEVAMYGFIPGFVYMSGLPEALQCPRKPVPAPNPFGKVLALGGPYLGIHSLSSPTGWQVIGKIPVDILRWEELPPVPMQVGDRIQVCPIDQKEFILLEALQTNIVAYNA